MVSPASKIANPDPVAFGTVFRLASAMRVIKIALERTELSPRELAVHFTDEQRYFLSESSAYRILEAADLITSPAYVLRSASDAFANPTTGVHEV